jgi:hypothetical protein
MPTRYDSPRYSSSKTENISGSQVLSALEACIRHSHKMDIGPIVHASQLLAKCSRAG